MTDEQSTPESWDARPGVARLLQVVSTLVPMSCGMAVAVVLGRLLPTSTVVAGVVVRIMVTVAASTAVVILANRVARRLLPLAALYRLSLVFPDRAPSRFRAALKAGSSRRVSALVAETRENGLPDDPGAAARRVVEMIGAIGDHDRRTRGHSERVRLYADLIGEEMRLTPDERQKLQWAALLHDIGKLMVPPEILNKNGKPTDEEWAILRRHPAEGERLIAPLRPFLGMWADASGGHHEWWNGTGYPRRLRGEEISKSAAIVAVADAYEVMTAVRSYKKSMPAAAARAELTRAAGVQFSPEVVRAFLCVSLGRLRVVAGPLASLAQIPFVGEAARFPATVSTALQSASGAAAAAAPSVAASVLAATTVIATTSTTTPAAKATPKAAVVAAAQVAGGAAPATTPGGRTPGTGPVPGDATEPGAGATTTATTAPAGAGAGNGSRDGAGSSTGSTSGGSRGATDSTGSTDGNSADASTGSSKAGGSGSGPGTTVTTPSTGGASGGGGAASHGGGTTTTTTAATVDAAGATSATTTTVAAQGAGRSKSPKL